ncbi:MAG: esterase [Segniliparus sp.]|uniref:esterase n=1 Tax=Segniliparus sp. TaxID=2804064 RepID=UPI003F2F83D9
MTFAEHTHVAPLSRRALLVGGAGAAVAAGLGAALWSPEDSTSASAGAGPSQASSAPPQNYPEFEEGRFSSAARGGADTKWSIQRPAGVHSVLHPVVLLHRLGGDHTSPFRDLQLAEALTTAVSGGVTPFALCSVDAQASDGSDSFYHPRSVQGKTVDSGKMILEELLPLLATKGLDISKVAFWGWGMGGYGALRLGALYEQAHAGAVAGIVATSPALGVRNPPSPQGSFDGPGDYQKNAISNYLDTLRKVPLRIDSGRSGSYVDGARALISELAPAQVQGGVKDGASEDDTFLKSLVPDELAFLGKGFSAR